MSVRRARSSTRSRATTGICRLSCLSVVSGNPFMPVTDDRAISRFDTPEKLARFASISSLTLKLSAPQSSRIRAAVGTARKISFTRSARRLSSVMFSPARRTDTGIPTGFPVSS